MAKLIDDCHSKPLVPEGSPTELTILIVSFNTREMTLECIRSVVSETRSTIYEVIVIDNNSQDGSEEAIRKEFPKIKLITLDKNVGFARANNIVASYATGKRLLLLNPDTIILNRSIDRLNDFANQTPLSRIWGGQTLRPNGSLDPTSVWRDISLWSIFCNTFALSALLPSSILFNGEAYPGWNRDTVRCVDIVTGCLLLIDQQLWTQLGGFDPVFFMYGEEADLCYRARRAKASPLFTPDAKIIHFGGASDSSSIDKRARLFRAKITLIERQFSNPQRQLARFLIVLHPLIRCIAYSFAYYLCHRQVSKQLHDWQQMWHSRREWLYGYAGSSAKNN